MKWGKPFWLNRNMKNIVTNELIKMTYVMESIYRLKLKVNIHYNV